MKKYIQDILNPRENTDFEKTKSTISDGISLRGYNLWILVCSTILASIGLDTNSTAVIIGTMLISPLMSPILGVGLSVAIHDKQVLTRSLQNLLIAVAISLSASVIYFFLITFRRTNTRTADTNISNIIRCNGSVVRRHFRYRFHFPP
jgi:uncharacterized membrane protein